MEKYTVDLEKVLDEFEYNEEQTKGSANTHTVPVHDVYKFDYQCKQTCNKSSPVTNYRRSHFENITLDEADFARCTKIPTSAVGHNEDNNSSYSFGNIAADDVNIVVVQSDRVHNKPTGSIDGKYKLMNYGNLLNEQRGDTINNSDINSSKTMIAIDDKVIEFKPDLIESNYDTIIRIGEECGIGDNNNNNNTTNRHLPDITSIARVENNNRDNVFDLICANTTATPENDTAQIPASMDNENVFSSDNNPFDTNVDKDDLYLYLSILDEKNDNNAKVNDDDELREDSDKDENIASKDDTPQILSSVDNNENISSSNNNTPIKFDTNVVDGNRVNVKVDDGSDNDDSGKDQNTVFETATHKYVSIVAIDDATPSTVSSSSSSSTLIDSSSAGGTTSTVLLNSHLADYYFNVQQQTETDLLNSRTAEIDNEVIVVQSGVGNDNQINDTTTSGDDSIPSLQNIAQINCVPNEQLNPPQQCNNSRRNSDTGNSIGIIKEGRRESSYLNVDDYEDNNSNILENKMMLSSNKDSFDDYQDRRESIDNEAAEKQITTLIEDNESDESIIINEQRNIDYEATIGGGIDDDEDHSESSSSSSSSSSISGSKNIDYYTSTLNGFDIALEIPKHAAQESLSSSNVTSEKIPKTFLFDAISTSSVLSSRIDADEGDNVKQPSFHSLVTSEDTESSSSSSSVSSSVNLLSDITIATNVSSSSVIADNENNSEARTDDNASLQNDYEPDRPPSNISSNNNSSSDEDSGIAAEDKNHRLDNIVIDAIPPPLVKFCHNDRLPELMTAAAGSRCPILVHETSSITTTTENSCLPPEDCINETSLPGNHATLSEDVDKEPVSFSSSVDECESISYGDVNEGDSLLFYNTDVDNSSNKENDVASSYLSKPDEIAILEGSYQKSSVLDETQNLLPSESMARGETICSVADNCAADEDLLSDGKMICPEIVDSKMSRPTSLNIVPHATGDGDLSSTSAGSGSLPQLEEQQLGKQPPFWVPDSEAPMCMQCNIKFTLIKRKHHCRGCGQVLCSKCCSVKAKLQYMNYTEARVCHCCFRNLEKMEGCEQIASKMPNPSNPMEYCSTVSPLLQVSPSPRPPPPSVLVPIPAGVLKIEGKTKNSNVTKKVMFSDGIRPGGDLTEPNVSEFRPTSRRPNRVTRRVGTPPGNSYISKKLLNMETKSFIPSGAEELPPIYIIEKGEFVYSELVKPITKGDPPLKYAINRNLFVLVSKIYLDCCVNREVWCMVSEGLACVGQDEIVFIVETLPDEKYPPKDIFFVVNYIHRDAAEGSTVGEMTYLPSFSNNLLDSKEHGGFIFIRPTFQCCQKLQLPKPPFLVGILTHRWETPWARLFPVRLVLRLGAEYRYYPCPLFSVRFRSSLFTDIGHTIITLLADFRKYAFTLPTVQGLVVHMEDRLTTILLPKNRYDQVARTLKNSDENVLTFAGNISPVADSHLVAIQSTDIDSSYQTQAINIHNKPRKVTGASFIVFNGSLKPCGWSGKSNIIEDGLMVLIPSDSMTALRSALNQMKDYSIGCGPQAEEMVILKWCADDANFNIGVKSSIDKRSLDGVPSIRVHNGIDYSGTTRFIRWTEVFIIQADDETNNRHADAINVKKLSESIARATCIALLPYLDLLATANLNVLAVRATIDPDNVGYEAGSKGERLPPLYMKSLDEELIKVVNEAAVSIVNFSSPVILELIFRIMEQG